MDKKKSVPFLSIAERFSPVTLVSENGTRRIYKIGEATIQFNRGNRADDPARLEELLLAAEKEEKLWA